MYKLIIAIFFFFSLSWLNLFLITPEVSAARKTADEVYVQPIKGLEESGLFGPTQSEIIEAVILDNYQVYCAAPAQIMSAEIGKKYIRYLELEPVLKTHRVTTTMTGSDDILNPLVLDDSGKEKTAVFKDNKQSYVQYLNNSKTNADPLLQDLVTADYYKLFSLEEQLAAKEKAKKNTIFLCNKLDIPLSKCPLNITVPGISMEIGEINIPDYDELVDPETRKELLESPHTKGTAYLPLARVYGKRPAYLVTCVEQKKSSASDIHGTPGLEDFALYMSTGWRSILSSFFGSLTHKLNLKRDECHVRTILVDAPTTEDESWNSVEAHNISRGFFTPYEDQIVIEDEYKKARGARNEIAQGELADGFDADDRVNLVRSANDQTQALTHMINGLAPACGNENIRTETAPTITSESNFSEGGATYKTSGKTADEDWGLLDSLFAKLNSEIETGERTINDINNRYVIVETFLIAPYDTQITMDQFFSPLEEYKITKEQAETIWPTHVLFNKGVGEGQEYRLTAGSSKSGEGFWDPEDCKWVEGHTNKAGEWVPGHEDCTQEYQVGISGADQPLGVDVITRKTGGNVRSMLSALPYDSAAYNHIEKYSSSEEANSEKLIKGSGVFDCLDDNGVSVPCGEVGKLRCECNGGYWKIGPDTDSCYNICDGDYNEELSCPEVKRLTTKLPTMNGLMKLTCSIAKNNTNDAQLLWGLMQIEGSPMLRKIREGAKSMSCGDIVTNSCGASGIVGVLIPQCIDKTACSQAADIANNTTDPWIIESRENPQIACNIEESMKYILRKRKSETSWLKEQYRNANGADPSTQQLYYMMAGRNYGVPLVNLVQPACGNYEAVDGCSGANYCKCTMDNFIMDCGNIK
jgi:hypothetical protein